MNKFRIACLASLIFLSTNVYAGKTHIGDGDTRAEACEVAERKAKIAAENSDLNGTCYDACSFDNCEKKGTNGDQYWSCKTTSANHRGSCERDSSKIRVY
ncbi:hypothetical protein [Alteromonas lipotrueae]|uniref:hypothetical protein n=1 Tax=Alteromonas lipotrueae TaxID=2803814 RepID=UPI001C4942BE|nr:hypothetical protein [Alteromonas lipotrueae]